MDVLEPKLMDVGYILDVG